MMTHTKVMGYASAREIVGEKIHREMGSGSLVRRKLCPTRHARYAGHWGG